MGILETENRFGPQEGQLERVKAKLLAMHDGEEISYTTCMANGCQDCCVLKVHHKDGKVTAIETDDTINMGSGREDAYTPYESFRQGMFQKRACVRGRGLRLDLYKEDRILYPLVRVGERGEGKFKRVSWDEALDLFAAKYLETREKYGPFSVWMDGVMGVSLDPFANYMPGGGLGGWAIDSYSSCDFADAFVLGNCLDSQAVMDQGEDRWNAYEMVNYFDSKLIILWGWDPCINDPEDVYYLRIAKERGVPIVVIDPRYTWSAQTLATQYIAIRPNTDTAMMDAMCYVMFEEDLCNHEFVEKWIEPNGLLRFQYYVMGYSDGVAKTPEWAASICGVPAETIREFAHLYAASTPCHLHLQWGTARQIYGENTARTSLYLSALAGNPGCKGGTATATNDLLPPHFPLPALDFGDAPAEYGSKNLLEAEEWSKAVILREKLEAGEITEREYAMTIGCPYPGPLPNIHMLFFCWKSPRNMAVNYQGVNERIEALKKVDFFAYGHWSMNNTTVRYADLVFPYSNQFFEGGHGGYEVDKFCAGWNPGVKNIFIYTPKIVDEPGECRHPYWVARQLAKRIGIGDKIFTNLAYDDPKEFDEALDRLSKQAYEEWMENPRIKPLNPPAWEDFIKQPIFRAPIEDYNVWMEKNRQEDIPLQTPSGKIEFYNDFLADGDLASETIGGRALGHGEVGGIARFKESPEGFTSAKTKKFPLMVVTPHSFYRQNTYQDDNRWFRDEYRNSVWMSVSDAKQRGIKDGDQVMVFNEVGQMIVPAYVTSRMTPGTCCVIFGRNYEPSSIKTDIMPDGIDMWGSCNFLIPNEHHDSIRGSLLDTALVDICSMESAFTPEKLEAKGSVE